MSLMQERGGLVIGRKAVFEEGKAGRTAVQELADLKLVRKALQSVIMPSKT